MVLAGVTIYDIAREAGVSPATVSRILTGNARVSEQKQILVKNIIEKYNFKPNAIARSLADTRTKILGLMAADIRNPFYATLVVECEKAANKRGYTVLLCNILNDTAQEDVYLEKLCAQRVDAIIQIGCRTDDRISDPEYTAHINRISRIIPFVTTGKLDGANYYSLNVDEAGRMKMAFDHLTSLGHQDIALIGGEKRVRSTYDKWQNYIHLLEVNGLPLREEYLQEGNYNNIGGYDCFIRLLQCNPIPTAIIAINDYSAIGVLRAAQEKSIAIPRDISLVSFDNTFLAEVANPMLTSIDFNYREHGEALIDLAINAAENKPVSHSIHFMESRLIIRGSTAPCSR
jgi:DNA-binding LacI/PurR family transcriptional regulator